MSENPTAEPADRPVSADQATPNTPATRTRRRTAVRWLIAVAVIVLALDQATKAWALSALDEGVRHPVLGDLLGIQLLFNPGAALGIATGSTWLLTLVALVVAVVIIRVSRRLISRGWALALGLLLGGAVGNLIDRLVRDPGFGRGHVIDFIAYWNWFVGNVADIAIVVAAGLLVILSLRGVHLDGTRESDGDEPVSDTPVSDEPTAGPTAEGRTDG